ncbi:hypothetical protein [Salinigranum halophilum]|uniref:hypothetical protein n=1 Tax=Salinigranum halophilum TaxID=2565931 RepID=UPI00115E3A81|nr:hypothetical protein [Salinigranum halophilum]
MGLFESRRLNATDKVKFVIDISERRESEEAVRESEARLEAFVTATSDVVYRMSPDWSENSVDHGGAGVTVRVGPLTNGFSVEDDAPGVPEGLHV